MELEAKSAKNSQGNVISNALDESKNSADVFPDKLSKVTGDSEFNFSNYVDGQRNGAPNGLID